MLRHFRKSCSFSLFTLVSLSIFPPQAAAGLLSITDELASASTSSNQAFKELLSQDKLFSRFIGEIMPRVSGKIAKGTAKEALRGEISKFAVDAVKISWGRDEVASFLSTLLSKSCGVNVSCSVAFDLVPGQIDKFLDELATSINKTVGTRQDELELKLTSLLRDYDRLAANSPAAVTKNAEIESLQREIDELEKFDIAASKLSRPLDVSEVADVNRICR